MSVSIEKLRLLKTQTGQGSPRSKSVELTHSVQPATAAYQASVPDSLLLPNLRKMLGRRLRSLVPLSSMDRSLHGDEIAPGLLYTTAHLPICLLPTQIPLHFAKRGHAIELKNVLFFDTETTGLAGGTGTRAFMIGAADWYADQTTGSCLRIRQLTITKLSAESAMLEAFASWLNPHTVLSSYNGKSYDSPLLKTRYRLARMREPLSALDHIDLLYPVRRRYRGVWENCKLATVEKRLLGIIREDDLPGSEAPGAWLSYLRGGSAANLRRVTTHNHQDVVTLSRLLLRLVELQASEP